MTDHKSRPDLTQSKQWMRTFPTSLLGIMSCYWTDVERGHVVPTRAGQVFQFVDLDEFWMYLGDSEPAPVPGGRFHWLGLTVSIIIIAILLVIDIRIALVLLSRLGLL